MDKVLVPYLTADDEREREQQLDELLSRHAAPLIRQVLRRKFGFYVSGQGINKNNQDAEDLYQEAITRVVQVLNQLQSVLQSSQKVQQRFVTMERLVRLRWKTVLI